MIDDKMRAEFEAWAKAVGHDLSQTKGDDRYWFVSTESAWESWQAAYQAGQKAEQAEVERLRGDVDFHSEAFKGLIDYLAEKKAENDKLRAELAAAKAASVVLCAENQQLKQALTHVRHYMQAQGPNAVGVREFAAICGVSPVVISKWTSPPLPGVPDFID